MEYNECKKEVAWYLPAFVADAFLPRRIRIFIVRLLRVIVLALIVVFAVAGATKRFFPDSPSDFAQKLLSSLPLAGNAFLIVFGLWIIAECIEAFYSSYIYRNLKSVFIEKGLRDARITLTPELSRIIFETPDDDLTRGFVESRTGRSILLRLGIGSDALLNFLQERKIPLGGSRFTLTKKGTEPFDTSDYALALLSADPELQKLLSVYSATRKELAAAARFHERISALVKSIDRWWGRDSLGRIRAIGKDWSYGGAHFLNRYGLDAEKDPAYGKIDLDMRAGASDLSELESVLSRARDSNALVVGDDEDACRELLLRLARRIENKTAMARLAGLRVFFLDGNALIAATKDKSHFEPELMRVLDESAKAGNIILVIDDFAEFIKSAETIGSEISSLIDPYLSSPAIHIVGLLSASSFHQMIEKDSKLTQRFEKISIKEMNEAGVLEAIEDEILEIEAREKIFFTYQSIVAIAESADRYFFEGVMPDKAIDLLLEIVPRVKESGKKIVEKEDILKLVEVKTGVPTGGLGEGEREKLLRLEEVLRERIVGQEEAVKAVANAMRRARSGINNPNRPMGSFLFLGPTGVGKTETTKALASAFFGDENVVLRIDMSEYRTDDALTRLIGSFEAGKVGVLSAMLRERPFGVLLLDEFEKTSKEVLDLFLQVLDEGFFSDMSGKRVNARNLIIIATSNAGSDLIWEMMKQKGKAGLDKDAIINEIITRGIYKPELLNRFDGVIIFHPLLEEELGSVARIMLEKLKKRLLEKGIELEITDELVAFLVREGADPKFGARPMNRAIQEKVEQTIAEKIIKGELQPGSTVRLTQADFVSSGPKL